MTWTVEGIEKVRSMFVMVASEPEVCMAEACRQFGVSRKTGYKWLRRYENEGLTGLRDRSRRPLTNPVSMTAEEAIEIVGLRNRHPTWGAAKIRASMAREGLFRGEIPSERTIARLLQRSGMVPPNKRGRPRRSVPGAPRKGPLRPNDVWTVDFKGWWRTRDGSRCEPLTVCDLFSRFVVCVRPMARRRTEEVQAVFAELFDEYGLPRQILSDNGAPFASMTGPQGLTRLSAWWRWLGIELVRTQPGHPEQNGAHERMHLNIAKEVEKIPSATVREEEKRLESWRNDYNTARPHAGIGNRTPGELYRLSERRIEHVRPYKYPEGMEVRRVHTDGSIKLDGRLRYVSQALAKFKVGLKVVDCNLVEVWFCDLLLGELDRLQATPLRPTASAPSPAE